MAIPDLGRISNRPISAYSNQSLKPETLPYESECQGVGIAGEDFLYHLSRGSELLKDNQVERAKEALELALSLQPQDVRGQGLLGVTYFRLGLYPRAIQIYRLLSLACPDEIAPKVNLALCYVKTGQHHSARDVLEEVVALDPGHARAYGYLGLVYQSLHEYGKAHAAFVSAGQPAMAERMRSLFEQSPAEDHDEQVPLRYELRDVAEGACSALESDSTVFRVEEPKLRDSSILPSRWRLTEPGEVVAKSSERTTFRPSGPPTARPPSSPFVSSSIRPPPLPGVCVQEALLGELLPQGLGGAAVFSDQSRDGRFRDWFALRTPSSPDSCVNRLDERTLWIHLMRPFAVRVRSLVSLSPLQVASGERPLFERSTQSTSGAVLGGTESPILGFEGPGKLLLRADSGTLELFELDGEPLTVLLSSLFGFCLDLQYESYRLRFGSDSPTDVVRFEGHGALSLAVPQTARAMEVTDEGLVVRATELIGWTAGVYVDALEAGQIWSQSTAYRLLRGSGTVLLS